MRKALDTLYAASGALAALFLVAIAVTVLLQVGANIISEIGGIVTGAPLGLVIPSYGDFTGFFLAASSFLALAYTLRHGAHIRVELIIQVFGPKARRWVEVWCLGLGMFLAGYFAWYSVSLTLESYEFGDVSFGMVPVPLWIPQAAMSLGLIILTISMLDELIRTLRGGMPVFDTAEADMADMFEPAGIMAPAPHDPEHPHDPGRNGGETRP